jgi:hypothetical protein
MAGDVNTYEQGSLVRLRGEFTDALTGAAINPDQVKFRLRAPDGSVTEYAHPSANVVQTSTGKYHVDWPADKAGRYTYRFFSTGNGMASKDRVFVVQPAGV